MTLVEDIRKLQDDNRAIISTCDTLTRDMARMEETVNGERGLSSAINTQTREIAGLRKAAYWVAGLIVAGAISFAFSVLLLIH